MKIFVALLLSVLTGCYSYVPLSGSLSDRGSPVRARLSTPEDVQLTDFTVNGVVVVDGEIVNHGTDTLIVSALALRSRTGSEFLAAGETVKLPMASLESVEAKRFSIVRTAAVTAAAAAVSLLLFSVFETGGGGGGNGGNPVPQ